MILDHLKAPLGTTALVLTLALLAACGGTRTATDARLASEPDVLAIYDGKALRAAEFEDRYARSAGGRESAATDSLSSYQDFLNRYADFRLKVLAGRQAGLEQDSSLLAEIQQYRTNLSRPYMLEQEVIDPVVRALFERQKTLVDASHILILAEPGTAPADTLAAFEKMQAVVDSARAGMPFAEAAVRFSEDPSARGDGPGGGGHLGFFTAGDMVDEFEDMAYTTPVGDLSPIFRTRFGYHVLKVNDRKPTPRDARVAHIMFRPQGGLPADLDSARVLAETVRDSILAGADFGELAARHSDDPGSAVRGGELGVLTWQTNVVEPFKSVALALEHDGDISEVTETSFGFHIIKLLERMPEQTYEEAYSQLKSLVSRLPRAQAAQNQLARRILQGETVTADTLLIVQTLAGEPYDSLSARYRAGEVDEALLAQPVASIGEKSFTMGDLLAFSATQRPVSAATPEDRAAALLEPFMLEKAIDVEAARLGGKDAEFARIMDEFKDGLLLFRVMEDSVWQAAQRDSVGLRAYFDAHRGDYNFPERTRIIAFNAQSDSLLLDLRVRVERGLSIAAALADTSLGVRVDTVMLAGPSNTIYDRALPLEKDQFVGPLAGRGVNRVLLFNDGIEPPRPKTFEEARAEVTTAYQEQLDNAFKARLRARYNLRLFPERLTQVFGGGSAPEQTARGTL